MLNDTWFGLINIYIIYNYLLIQVGDKILTVNGESTEGMSHDQVVSCLRAARKVTLEVMQGQ